MTPNDLALLLTPSVQEAAELAKNDILKDLPAIQRVFARAFWGLAMKRGIPIANQIIIEFLIAKYRSDIEPTIGEFVNLLIKSINQENVPALKLLGDILDVLHTPTSQFLPVVQTCLDPNIVHEAPQY